MHSVLDICVGRTARVVVIAALASLFMNTTPTAHAKSTWLKVRGAAGQELSVLSPGPIPVSGTTLTVRGRAFDETVGIYVALCVLRGANKAPTPCGGGVDKTGSSHASVWVSSNPPPYGVGLATPFGIDGKFTVKLRVGPVIGKYDCRKVRCAVVTKADHTNPDFRGADVSVPLTFKRR